MKKTVLSCVAILSLCVAAPAMADVDETFMDWSYASGLDPKPRPVSQERQRNTSEFTSNKTTEDMEILDADIFATSEIGQASDTQDNFNSSEYANWSYTSTQNSAQTAHSANAMMGQTNNTQAWNNNEYNATNMMATSGAYPQNTQTGQTTATPQYYQVPIQAIQTPAEVHRIANPVKVQYPVTKQYPISMQYPVTIQKEITVQRPVVVQQPIVVQRPIVMQQPVMVQHQPLMVQNKPLMVQQQPTVVQKQPIVVNAPAPTVIPTPVMQMSGGVTHMMPAPQMIGQQHQTPCALAEHNTQMLQAQQMPQMGYGMAPSAQTFQIPMQVNGTLTGTFVPTTGCNGGCLK